MGQPMNVQFYSYRTNGEAQFEADLKEIEKKELARSGILKSDVEAAWDDMRKRGMTVQEYIQSKQEQGKKQNKFVSARIENGNTLYLKTEGGEEIKVKFLPFNAEDSGEKFKAYLWQTDNGDEHELMVYGDGQDEVYYEINGARQFSLPLTVEQGNALRAQLDEYVANELGGGRRRRRVQRRKTRRTKASRRRQTRARRVRN